MWESLGNFLKSDGGKTLGSLLGTGLQGYGVLQQSKMMKDLLNMQKQDRQEEKDRKKRTQARLDLAFSDHKYDSPSLPLG